MAIKALKLESRTSFNKNGRDYDLRDADGPASEKQVMMLYRSGHLLVVADKGTPFTKGEASFALDATSASRA